MSCPIIHDFGKKTPHFFCSNFFPVPITVTILTPDGSVTETYPSVEHAFQAAKTSVADERKEFQNPELYAGTAKKMGRFVTLRKNWESCKVSTMAALLHIKFQNPNMRELLLETRPKMLIEGNYWHDNFWGICFCPASSKGCEGATGINTLGKLLMNLRRSLQTNPTKEVSMEVTV